MYYTLSEKVSMVVEQRDIAIKSLESINYDLSNEEHVDSDWIRDVIESNSGLSIVERANFNIQIKKLITENTAFKDQLSEAWRKIDEIENQ